MRIGELASLVGTSTRAIRHYHRIGLLLAFAYVSLIETVVLAFLIPWPLVRGITLVLDLWGVYFILGLFASFVVRPHVIGADGSLRLRSGALLDIRIPARDATGQKWPLRAWEQGRFTMPRD